MPGSGDARRPVDVQPDVVVTTEPALAGVQPHPDSDRSCLGPRLGGQSPLDLHGGAHRGRGAGEHHEEGVAFGADLHAAGPAHRLANDDTVLVQHLGEAVTERLQQPR
ncbi:MAG TPA: hypothetical protein VHF25_04245 [Nitriliruptorales bacterium]|nr:hypothetical protein [Nitriliruptorales bacterium]